MKKSRITRLRHWVWIAGLLANSVSVWAVDGDAVPRSSKISDQDIALLEPDEFPQRPRPLLELGSPLLGTGTIDPGIELPTGAVWQPALTVYGTLRSSVQIHDDGLTRTSEWVNRLDLLANLQLSGTERVLLAIRPLDRDGRFAGETFTGDPSPTSNAFNGKVSTLFFEGDIGEIIPELDADDNASLNLGFSVGRQPFSYQEGMLIDDTLDALGVIRNTLLPTGGSDLQYTFVWAWNELNRNDNAEDPTASLYGLFVGADFSSLSANLDLVYVDGGADGDGLFFGLSSVQRLGHFNTAFRLLGSYAVDGDSAAVSDGYLLFGELSWTPPWSNDNVYIDAFWGINDFSSAARGPSAGGPLGRVGILYEAAGTGRFAAALGDRPEDSIGGAAGYQLFLADTRKQWVFEIGARQSAIDRSHLDVGFGVRFQQAFGRRWVMRLDGFLVDRDSLGTGWGSRMEWSLQF